MAAKSAKARKAETKPVVAPYELTPEQNRALRSLFDQKAAKRPVPRMKVTQEGDRARIAPDHPDPIAGSVLLTHALGTTSDDFSDGLLNQLVSAGSKGAKADESGINFMLAVVTGLEPRDEVEAMLAAQMTAVHMATMTFARRLNHIENTPSRTVLNAASPSSPAPLRLRWRRSNATEPAGNRRSPSST